jgi:hypothetical protein
MSTYEVIGQFHSLRQTGTVPEYVNKFEELMGLVKRDNPSLVDDYFTGSFVVGLKEPIQHHLQCHKPNSLTQAFWFARRLEQANIPQKRFPMFNTVFKQPKQGTRDKKLLTRKMHQILLS